MHFLITRNKSYLKLSEHNKNEYVVISLLFGIMIYGLTISTFQFFSAKDNVIIPPWAYGEVNGILVRAWISNIRVLVPICSIIIMVHFIKSFSDFNSSIKYFLIGCFMSCIYGVYEFIVRIFGLGQNFLLPGHSDSIIFFNESYRLSGTFGEPSYFAGFLVVGIIISWLAKYKGIIQNPSFFIIIILQVFCLLLTYSTVGWISLFIGLLSISLIQKQEKNILLAMLMAIIGVFVISQTPNLLDVFLKPFDTSSSLSSASERMNTAITALNVFKEYPVSGIGYGMYGLFSVSYAPPGTVFRDLQPIVNNVYLEVLCSYGLVGSFLFFIILSKFLKSIFFIKNTEHLSDFFPFILGVLIAIAITFMAYPTFNYTYHWFFFGLLFAISKVKKSE